MKTKTFFIKEDLNEFYSTPSNKLQGEHGDNILKLRPPDPGIVPFPPRDREFSKEKEGGILTKDGTPTGRP